MRTLPPRWPYDNRAADDGDGEGALVNILEAALSACAQHLRESKAWRADLTARVETICRATAPNADLPETDTQAIAKLQEAITNQTCDPELPPADVARLEAQLSQLNRAEGVHARNMEQMRLQAEGLARNFEKLSQEVLLHQVMDPFFVAFARLYEAV